MGVVEVLSKAVATDEVAGCALIDSVVYDFVADLAEVNRDAISGEIGIWALDRVQVAKRALGRSYVDTVSKGMYPEDDVQLAATWLAGLESYISAAVSGEFSKSGKSNEWWMFNGQRKQRTVSRDAAGRFTRGVNQSGKAKNVSALTDAKNMSPALASWTDGVEWKGKMTPDAAARHQYQYEEATGHALEFKRAFKGDAKNVDAVLMLQDPNGDIRMLHVPMDKVHERDGDRPARMDVYGMSADDRILGVEVAPGVNAPASISAKVAEFNLLGGAGGSQLAGLAMTDPKLRSNLKNSLKMPSSRDDTSALSRVFGVLSAGGAVLGSVTGSEKVSQMAALVGEMGPQAEEVLGPYVKRSAYRYRGTEKTPDPAFRNPLNQLNDVQLRQVADDFKGASPESLTMHATADVASGHLAETLQRDPIISRLSERAGRVLPSQGVIYDAKGKIVSQSVGFSDDHYLPFDLMNIGRLRGGQYVRTRQQGGLTGEDVYTAVMSGARQVQVVSGSGVFTLEMSPDFRGARAMSDKARGMYDAYLKILDAVDESGLYLVDISPKEKATLAAEAKDELGSDATPQEVKALRDRKITAAREKSRMVTPEDEAEVAEAALREAGGEMIAGKTAAEAGDALRGDKRRIFEDAYKEGIDAKMSSKASELRLNGAGYAIALATLRQQFPYFIQDVHYRELKDLPTDRPGARPGTRQFADDSGYVKPGSLRAKNVRTGFYNPGSVEPGAKSQRDRPAGETAAEAKAKPTDTTTAAASAADADSGADRKKAPSVGIQGMLDHAAIIDPALKQAVGDLKSGINVIPLKNRTAAMIGNEDLPFASVSKDPAEAVKWLLASDDFEKVMLEMTGKNAEAAVAALGNDDAVRSALIDILTSTGEEVDEFFGNRKIGGSDNIEMATDWVRDKGRAIGDLVAMREGFAEAPKDKAAANAYRGLMPMLLPDVSRINNKEQFDAFMADPKNAGLSEAAASIAYDDRDLRSVADMSKQAKRRLDALGEVAAAKASAKAMSLKGNDPMKQQLMTGQQWKDATGRGEKDEQGKYPPPSSRDVIQMDTDALMSSWQAAWSLAVTARVLDSIGGGTSWDLKEGDRTLEPVDEAMSKASKPLVRMRRLKETSADQI